MGGHQVHPRDASSLGSRAKAQKNGQQKVKEIEMADFSSMRGSIEESVRLEQSMNRLMPSKKNDLKRQYPQDDEDENVVGDEIV